MRRRFTGRGLALGTAIAAIALWATPAFAADENVTMQGFAFDPGEVTVTVGDSVTWSNVDGASHTATANDGSFDTGGIGNGGSGSITFDTAGTFPYHCNIHPDMTATVIVEAGAASPSPAASSSGGSGGGGGGSTPPATETLERPSSSTSPDVAVVSLLALTLVGLGVAALLVLRLRPVVDEVDVDR